SVHGRDRVATERTTFAMPETGIGLFPDVGGTWFLPKLSGEVGTWLALTGARVKGADVAALGLATHFCESAQLSALKSSLIDGGIEVLDNYMPEGECSFAEHLAEIDTLFAGDCALTIKGRLEEGSEWAKGQASKLNTASPLSTKIALHQMRTKESLGSLQDALTLEYRVACRMVQSNDFQEGVRAVLIDKDQSPKWHPASLPATSADMVLQYFSPLDTGELSFLEI
ncbi:MAG: enoyl-CoA hydratase/isomerase family protein, partial [Pseudomonadota bacterium]